MESATQPTKSVYSNSVAFSQFEEILLGVQSKKLERAVLSFHPNITCYLDPSGDPIGYSEIKLRIAEIIEKVEAFYFKVRLVTFDTQLSLATAVFNYECRMSNNTGFHAHQISIFKIENNLITELNFGVRKIINQW
jgi:hypothetical protein